MFPTHVVKEWAGHASIETTDEFYLKVSEAEYQAAASQSFGLCTQLCAQLGDSEGAQEKPESSDPGLPSTYEEAGDGTRTHDVQLGKLAFCH